MKTRDWPNESLQQTYTLFERITERVQEWNVNYSDTRPLIALFPILICGDLQLSKRENVVRGIFSAFLWCTEIGVSERYRGK